MSDYIYGIVIGVLLTVSVLRIAYVMQDIKLKDVRVEIEELKALVEYIAKLERNLKEKEEKEEDE